MRNAEILTGCALRVDAGRKRMAAIRWPRVHRDLTNGGGRHHARGVG